MTPSTQLDQRSFDISPQVGTQPATRPWKHRILPAALVTASMFFLASCADSIQESAGGAPANQPGVSLAESGHVSSPITGEDMLDTGVLELLGQGDDVMLLPMSGDYPVLDDGGLGRPIGWQAPPEPRRSDLTRKLDAFGARQFARYYLQLLAYMANTGDTDPLREVSSADCEPCMGYADYVESYYDAGKWADGLQYIITDITPPLVDRKLDGVYYTRMKVMALPHTEYLGDAPQEFEEFYEKYYFRIETEDSRLVMRGFSSEDIDKDDDSPLWVE